MTVDKREAAKNTIAKLRKSNGALSAGALEVLKRDFPDDLESVNQARRKLGAATRTLATNLYSTDVRCFYELIQNAEDNSYSRAALRGQQPFLKLSLYPDRIEIDSNEDGFQDHDVAAICSTGESTKKAKGYIGEKGIGFKSVFKIARRVQIQSEPFSFAFEYLLDSDDDGLGMVTPILENFVDLPATVQTRMTLTLTNPQDFEERANDLRKLPDTLLLFLGKLRGLSINIHHENGTRETRDYHRETHLQHGMEVISKKGVDSNGDPTFEKSHFLVIKRTVGDLPSYPSRKGINQADVVLAFPLTVEMEPIVQQQHVFAYLPLRQVGLKFLIQSDFITQASREDIFVNKRNEALLDGVAETFRDAVLQFVKHSPLQYQWMRYLPDENISDQFWATLRSKIHRTLQKTSILRSWSGKGLFTPDQLVYVVASARDENHEPLFADLAEEIYLAKQYSYTDYCLLRPLGCQYVDMNHIIDRAASDMRRNPEFSRMKNPNTSEDWHCRVARVFETSLKTHEAFTTDRIKALPFIPLSDETWVSAKDASVFFPDSGPCQIPDDLGYSLVKSSALKSASRKEFYAVLGVQNCDPQDVVNIIYRQHRKPTKRSSTNGAVAMHMRYLYHHLPKDTRSLDREMRVFAREGDRRKLLSPSMVNVYFHGESELGARKLFKRMEPDIPGLPVWILDDYYGIMSVTQTRELPWLTWLEQVACLRSLPPACANNVKDLSAEFRYLAKHRPNMLFQLLQKNWLHYAPEYESFGENLKATIIPSASGEPVAIHEAYVSLPEIVEQAHRFGLADSVFLPLSSRVIQEDRAKWDFLQRLGVRFTVDLDFYLKALARLSSIDRPNTEIDAIFDVYAGVEKYTVSPDQKKKLSLAFQETCVLLPENGDTQAVRWVELKNCRWSGSDWLESKHCLACIQKYESLSNLFVTLLKTKNADYNDALEELDYMKDQKIRESRKLLEIYRYLWREFGKDTSSEYLRTQFENRSLVFAPRQSAWFPPSACVWANEKTLLLEKASISTSFAGLEGFFCDLLQIPKPNVEMRVATLKDLAKKQQFAQIKAEIMAIAALNPSASELKSLRKTNIFHVRAGNEDAIPTNSESDWVIVDRKEYADAFKGHRIHMLDYTMNEVQKARKFFEAIGLEKKFLSAAVQEKTMVKGGHLSPDLTHRMRAKAYALYRCAVHFGSSRLDDDDDEFALFETLGKLEVFETDLISKSIILTQSGVSFVAEINQSNIHLEQDDSKLRLFVPIERRRREVCYFQQLPREILKYFNVSETKAEAVLKSVIGASSLDVLDDVLADEGIVEVSGVQRLYTAESSDQDPPDDFVGGFSTTSDHELRGYTPTPGFLREYSDNVAPVSRTTDHGPSIPWSLSTNLPVSNAGYTEILEHAITVGEIALLPAPDATFQNSMNTGLPAACRFSQIQFPDTITRDKSVGAAGELFVFKIFESFHFSGFTIDNWQSGIRHFVREHSTFSSLERWQGHETADLVYHDEEGKLTQLLVDKGYLEEGSTIAAPKYYLEVKTTTGACRDPFYMSSNQYRMMQRMQLRPANLASEILIIFRVFSVDRPNLGLKLFVDPEGCRRNGQLNLEAEKWVVRSA